MGNEVQEVVDVDIVLDEFHVFWSLLCLNVFRIDIWELGKLLSLGEIFRGR
jgi:hypothetical protein